MEIRSRLFVLFVAGLIAVMLASALSCSESEQPATGRSVSDSVAPDFILKDLAGADFTPDIYIA